MTMTTERPIEDLPSTAPKVYAAIAAITADIGKIAKDGKGPATQGGYPFLPVDSIIEKLNPLLREHGVILREHVLDVQTELDTAIKATPDGTPVYDGRVPTIRVRVLAQIEWTWISVFDGSEMHVVNFGEAHDVADKAIRKANTAAYKEMLLRTFSIVAGENDPDGIDPNEEAEAVSERRNRGQQKIDNAARPRAGRTTARRETPKAPAPEAEPEAKPEPKAAEPTQYEAVGNEPAAEPAAETVTEAKAEQQDATWRPDPEDIAHAEKVTQGPVEPVTQAEKRSENISELKNELRRAWSARGMTRDDVNALGRKLTGKEPSAFLFNATDLKALMRAVTAGEVA